jgi:nucleoside phosphorylase
MAPELSPIVRHFGLAAQERAYGRVYVGTTGDRELVAGATSIGTAAATRMTEQVLDDFAFDHLVVVGIAGGIDAGLRLGEVVCPESVLLAGRNREARATPLGPMSLQGRSLTSDELYVDPRSVQQLREQGYLVVDMETAAIGLVAEERGVPWTAFRAVSDFAGDSGVDHSVVGLSRPDGSPDPGALARFLLTRPWRIPQLVRLGRGMRLAVRTSTRAAIEALG